MRVWTAMMSILSGCWKVVSAVALSLTSDPLPSSRFTCPNTCSAPFRFHSTRTSRRLTFQLGAFIW
eukprot:761361-Hanusia_phi.AAC.8